MILKYLHESAPLVFRALFCVLFDWLFSSGIFSQLLLYTETHTIFTFHTYSYIHIEYLTLGHFFKPVMIFFMKNHLSFILGVKERKTVFFHLSASLIMKKGRTLLKLLDMLHEFGAFPTKKLEFLQRKNRILVFNC
jgi:hypothetical protein